jgi:HlyD family secretion protein
MTTLATEQARAGAGQGAGARTRARLRKRSLRWVAWLVALVVVAGAAVGFAKGRKVPSLAVRTHTLARGDVRDLVTSVSAGRVTADKEVTLRAELSGSVRKLVHRRGDRVELGEPLVVYDSEELRERSRAAESAVALAKAQSAQAKANAALSGKTADRAAKLHESGSTAAADLDNARGQADSTASAAEAAQASLGQASANLDVARTSLSKSIVRAPFAGLVLETNVEQGEVVSPGVQLLRMADTSRMYVEADIDEADLGRVALGMPAEIALDAFPNQRLTGKLYEIAPSVNKDVRGSRSIAVKVSLDPDPRLRVGMSADVDVIVATQRGVLWIPPNAVMGRGTDRTVYVAQAGRAVKRSIGTGVSTWERVEVTSGLGEGDRVIVTLSVPGLADGVPVALPADAPGGVR